jgi:hypothetical protein
VYRVFMMSSHSSPAEHQAFGDEIMLRPRERRK